VASFDSPRSTDHDWGPRLQILLPDSDADCHATALTAMLASHLPESFRGYPVAFPITREPGGTARHRVEVTGLGTWLTSQRRAPARMGRPGHGLDGGNPRERRGVIRIPLACLRSVPFLQGLTERSEGMMATESQAEIAASVAALQDLGPGYDQALAEGLVERIGAEIDKRIAAEMDNRITAEVDSRLLTQLDRYAGCRHQRRRARRMIRAERRTIRAERADRSGRQSLALALGSMLVALAVTAVVLKGSPGVAALMLMALIWVIVGIVNVAYAVRKYPQQ
jgi:hypothetical protein